MAEPTLYKEDGKNELQSAHTLAPRWGVSVRVARKKIQKLLMEGKLKVFRESPSSKFQEIENGKET